jgi:hypothetical protein
MIEDLKLPEELVAKEGIESIKEHLNMCQNAQDVKYLKEWLLDPLKWRYPRVSFDTFLNGALYLNAGENVYPELRRMGNDILNGKYSEGVIVAGIGAGKTTLSELLVCYATHYLLCLRNPHKTYKLAKDKPITIINMGTTATQALEVTFAGIKNFIFNSPWFGNFNPNILSGTIRFSQNNILLMSGNSRATTPLGYNIFCGVLDEAAFYMDNDNHQTAEEIYTALQRRVTSRFGYDGLVIMISSPRYEGDFIMRKLEDAKKFPEYVYGRQIPTWKCKPIDKADLANKFLFNQKRGVIVSSAEGLPVSLLEDAIFDQTKDIWEIPGEYRKAFQQDPEKAKRDFAAVPSKTIQAFMPNTDLIGKMFTEAESPIPLDEKTGISSLSGKYKFSELPLRTSYFIHVDLALNKEGKGDYAGLAMAHLDGWNEDPITKERSKKVEVDLAERIGAGPTGEIRFSDVREKIYALKAMGFTIRLVTFDGFNSADAIQILRSKGIRSELLSVDRIMEPYDTLKELIYDLRIKCHKMPKLKEELSRLEQTKAAKIDHPEGGSKDVSDAVCGAVYNVIKNTSNSEMGILTSDVNPTIKPESRDDYYRRLDKMAKEGLL